MIKLLLVASLSWGLSLAPTESRQSLPEKTNLKKMTPEDSLFLYAQLKRVKAQGASKQTEILCSKVDFKSARFECFYKWDLHTGNPKLETLVAETPSILAKYHNPQEQSWEDSLTLGLRCENKNSCYLSVD